MEIGDTVKHLDSTLIEDEPTIAWNLIARMRDLLVHQYRDTESNHHDAWEIPGQGA